MLRDPALVAGLFYMLQEGEQFLSHGQEALKSPEREAFPKVAVVLLHYGLMGNGGEATQYTEQCLGSVETIDYPNFEIVVLDAGSTDGFSEKYKEGFSDAFPRLPKTTLLRFEENVGCAQGYNMAVEYAIKEGAEYLFLLNNDTIVLNSDILANLVDVVVRFPEVVAVGPKIYYWKEQEEEPEIIQFIGGRFAYRIVGTGQEDRGQFDEERAVDFLSGAAMLVRADVIKRIGLFDPRFFVYLEEFDFAARAKVAGYKCIFSPGGQVRHKGRHSIDKRYKPPYVEGSARNYMLLIRKHSGKQKAQFIIRATTVIGKSIFGIIAKEKNPRRLKNLAKSMCDGWRLELE